MSDILGAGEGKALVRTKIKWGGVDVPSNNVGDLQLAEGSGDPYIHSL